MHSCHTEDFWLPVSAPLTEPMSAAQLQEASLSATATWHTHGEVWIIASPKLPFRDWTEFMNNTAGPLPLLGLTVSGRCFALCWVLHGFEPQLSTFVTLSITQDLLAHFSSLVHIPSPLLVLKFMSQGLLLEELSFKGGQWHLPFHWGVEWIKWNCRCYILPLDPQIYSYIFVLLICLLFEFCNLEGKLPDVRSYILVI